MAIFGYFELDIPKNHKYIADSSGVNIIAMNAMVKKLLDIKVFT